MSRYFYPSQNDTYIKTMYFNFETKNYGFIEFYVVFLLRYLIGETGWCIKCVKDCSSLQKEA